MKDLHNCVFIVEDDEWYADLLEYYIKLNPEYTTEKFLSGRECLNNLHKNPIAITLDFSLPDINGKEILKRIRQTHPQLPVIIISGQKDINTAVQLLKEGAYDYIVKDEDTQNRLWNILRNIRETSNLRQENQQLKEQIGKRYDFSKTIIGSSAALKNVFAKIVKSLDTNITVSITGETGTGKELVAKAIHYNSPRKKNPLVVINVAGTPSELIESELFGHEKGAFTGANSRRIGKFEEADKGTIFLDEIAEIDHKMQTKLLRVLQERQIIRIGSNSVINVDVRVITATHKDLTAEVKNGNFRADLFYRLMGMPIKMPPLRERGKDILVLAKYFADEFCKENKRENVTFTPDSQKKLLNYSYPGNIRELKSVIELAIIMGDDNIIKPDDLTFLTLDQKEDLLQKDLSLDEYNKEIIKYYLEKYEHKAIPVAKKLKIAKSTLYRLMKKYELK